MKRESPFKLRWEKVLVEENHGRWYWIITSGEERAGELGGDVEKPQSTNKGLTIGNS